jgi:hypothetical protein
MPFRGKETADMMRTAARLHGDGTGWKTARELGECRPPDAAAQNDLPLRVQAYYAVQVLAQIDPRVTMVIGSLLPLKHTGTITWSRREGRAIP